MCNAQGPIVRKTFNPGGRLNDNLPFLSIKSYTFKFQSQNEGQKYKEWALISCKTEFRVDVYPGLAKSEPKNALHFLAYFFFFLGK